MRRHTFRSLALVATAVGISIGVVFGYAARGEAAGTGICPAASCLSVGVSPHVASADIAASVGQSALAAGKFDNKSNSTATHLNLSFSFADASDLSLATVRVDTSKITVLVDGAVFTAATCTPAQGAEIVERSKVACDLGNLAGGHDAKLLVPFTPVTPSQAPSKIEVTFGAIYGESGKDNAGGINDNQKKSDTLRIAAASAAGKCTKVTGTDTDTVSGGSATATMKATYPAAANSLLPCTPAATGVYPDAFGIGGVGEVVFVELPNLTAPVGSPLLPGFATVIHSLTPLPANQSVKSFVLNEALPPDFLFAAGSIYFQVPATCASNGLPPNYGTPALENGVWNGKNDSCIFSRRSLPKGGGEFTLHVIGNVFDPRYTP